MVPLLETTIVVPKRWCVGPTKLQANHPAHLRINAFIYLFVGTVDVHNCSVINQCFDDKGGEVETNEIGTTHDRS
jgi:hypothetical protein